MGLGLLQGVDDLPILDCTLRDGWSRGSQRRRGLPRLHGERHRALAHSDEADQHATGGLGEHLRGIVAPQELGSGREQHRIAPDPERACEDQRAVPLEVALLVAIGLDDPDARLTVRGNRPRQVDLDELVVVLCPGNAAGLRGGAPDDLEAQRLSVAAVEDALVGRLAPGANGIEIGLRAGGGGGHVIDDPELRGARSQQLVAGIGIRLSLSRDQRRFPRFDQRRMRRAGGKLGSDHREDRSSGHRAVIAHRSSRRNGPSPPSSRRTRAGRD